MATTFTDTELDHLLDHASDMVSDYRDEPQGKEWETIHNKILALKKEKDQTIRQMVNTMDGIAEEIKYQLENIDCDQHDMELETAIEELQGNITEYQENKGWI